MPIEETTSHQYADTTGRAVLETIRNYGVTTVFGIPGTHNLELYRPLAGLGIRAITNRHEQGSGYGADGWSQRTGLPGVVITTSGPGLQNAMSAVGTAYCESRPMLVISPGPRVGEEFADVGTLHETKDSTTMAGSVAAWSRRVASGAEAVEAIHDAFALFAAQRPRPVHLEIPLDVLEAKADVPFSQRAPRNTNAHPELDRIAIEQATSTLAASHRAVLIAGGGATGASAQVTELAERIGAPVLTTINGKGTLDEHHPLSLGSNLRLEAARDVAEAADVLLIVGSKLGEAELWAPRLEAKGTVIRIDISPEQLQKNLASTVQILGDAGPALTQILLALDGNDALSGSPWSDLDEVRAAIAAEARLAFPNPYGLAEIISAALPQDAVIAGDSSQIVYLGLANVVRQREPRSFLYTPTYATLGYGLPAGIGARVASTDRPVVTVIGDGALMFCMNEFLTAAEQQLDLTVICVDNGGYAEIKQNELDRKMQPVGVDLLQPDWCALVAAMGGNAVRVDSPERIATAIHDAVRAGGVQFVHIPQPEVQNHPEGI